MASPIAGRMPRTFRCDSLAPLTPAGRSGPTEAIGSREHRSSGAPVPAGRSHPDGAPAPLLTEHRTPLPPVANRRPAVFSRSGSNEPSRTRKNPTPIRAGNPTHLPHPRRVPRGPAAPPGSKKPTLSPKQPSQPICSLQQPLYGMKRSFAEACLTILNHSGKDHYDIFKYN